MSNKVGHPYGCRKKYIIKTRSVPAKFTFKGTVHDQQSNGKRFAFANVLR